MKYLINQVVLFDSFSGLVSRLDEKFSSVQLSKPGLRLLHELITHCGITLTRESLLQNVWEEYGLIPSNNNLSNHISFLRKIFSQMGITESIIITVPREGFRLEANIQSLTSSINHPEKLSETHPSFTNDYTFNKYQKQKNYSNLIVKNIRIIVIMVIIIFTTILVVNKLIFYDNNITQSSIGLCQLVDISSDKNNHQKQKTEIIKNFINNKNIDCIKKQSTVYFNISNLSPEEKHNQRTVFLYQCFSSRTDNGQYCENYLSINITKP